MACWGWYSGLGLLLFVCLSVSGQDSTAKPEIYSLRIQSDIKFRFATTLVSSRMVNPVNASREAVFSVTLPDNAFISNFTLEIDGVIYPATIDEKGRAKAKFERAKKRGQSAGHVSKKPRDTNIFKVQVNVAALSSVAFNLTYQELLRRSLGLYQHKVYVDPGQPVDDLQIDVAILESREITTLRVPPIRNDLLTSVDVTASNDIAIVTKPTPKTARILYIPDVEYQLTHSTSGISGQFVVEYDIERDLDSGDLLVVNGCFVHFLAPDVKTAIPKDVYFVLDKSGSMTGVKLTQVKDAIYIILDDLNEGDRFNIMTFTHVQSYYRDEMIVATQSSIRAAKRYIRRLRANGGTEIYEALRKSIQYLKSSQIKGERSPVVVFLTDGQAGRHAHDQILGDIKKQNEGNIPIFSLAFGSDADWDLVRKVAILNNGVGRKIYEDSDAALQIAGFYDEIAVTLLNNVTVKYLGDSVNETTLTKSHFNNYFLGSEVVVAGKLDDVDANTVDVEVLGNAVEGAIILPTSSGFHLSDFPEVSELTKEEDFQRIVEKTWAYITIKQLLEQADAILDATHARALKERALQLSLQYSFVTPLTSLVVTKPEEEEPQDVEVDGQVDLSGDGGDPHYMIRERGIDFPICFDVISQQEEIYRLLKDPNNDVTINAAIGQSQKLNSRGERKSFIVEIGVLLRNHRLVVTTETILLDNQQLSWDVETETRVGQHLLSVSAEHHRLSLRFHFGPELVVKLHWKDKNDGAGVSFLNTYIRKEDGFGRHSSGLLGHFVNAHVHISMKKSWNSTAGIEHAKFQITHRSESELPANANQNEAHKKIRHVFRAHLIKKNDVVAKGELSCWMVQRQSNVVLYGYLGDMYAADLLQA